MKKKRLLILLLSIASSLCSFEDVSIYLNNRIAESNVRHSTFTSILELMNKRNSQMIVETGTSRCGDENFDGDGGSTIIFGDWAVNHNAKMFSVDINPQAIEMAKEASLTYLGNLDFITGDSVAFLKNFQGTIDVLYLDSWDYDVNHPELAQEHCLKEVQAAYDKLTDQSIIMIDDCNISRGGKGKLAIRWLKKHQWRLYRNKHQVILVKQGSI